MRTVLIGLALAAALCLVSGAGCIAVSNPHTVNRATTLGQELIDLQQAKDNGAISEQEYQQLRKKLIDALGRPCPHKQR
jgi:hypothetical protein